MSDLSRLLSRMAVPSKSFLFMGADPCHTPVKEDQARVSCKKCGGERELPNGKVVANAGDSDPIRPYETLSVACVCGRAAYRACDSRGKQHVPDLSRPGQMAARITGKPDPALNAYVAPGKTESKADVQASANAEADRADADDRTGAAVADHAAGQPEPARPLTRREKRREKFGQPGEGGG